MKTKMLVTFFSLAALLAPNVSLAEDQAQSEKNYEIVADNLQFPEATLYTSDGTLYFVEWGGDKIWKNKNGENKLFLETAKGDGPNGLALDPKTGNIWVAMYSSGKVANYTLDGKLVKEYDGDGQSKFVGPNDFAFDRQGGLYITDSGNFEDDWATGREAGRLFYLDADGKLSQLDKGFAYSNGVGISPDGTKLYVGEHRKNQIVVYDITGPGQLANRRVFAKLDDKCAVATDKCFEVGPDGMKVDKEGNVWAAHYAGGKLIKINPSGETAATFALPVGDTPTNLDFSPDGDFAYVSEVATGSIIKIPIK